MSVLNTIKTIKGRVEHLLNTQPELRDDDAKLVATIQYHEIGKSKMDSITSLNLLAMLANNEVTYASSIDRARRILQKEHKHLRGKNYAARHREAEDVRTNIHDV